MSAPLINIPHFDNPSSDNSDYVHPRKGRPFLFQVTDPELNLPLYPVLLALHINPENFSEKMRKSKSVVVTKGGYVEFVWPDDLDSISADGSTGAFISPEVGLTSGSAVPSRGFSGRQNTMAWERQQDFLELFRNNGVIYNGSGVPVLRGRVMCMFDRGIYFGHFQTFQVVEDDNHSFSFNLSWTFQVEFTLHKFPSNSPAGFPFGS
jgi:hypothetical protein